jgi:polysaccharide export outer membrane protein
MRNYLLMLFCLALFSCKSTKQHMHFYEIADTLNKPVTIQQIQTYEPQIELGDILSINIQTADFKNISGISDANSATGSATTSNVSTTSSVTGYTLDSLGFIKLPLIGKVKVLGLTVSQIKDLLSVKAREFYNDPILSVKLANFKITVLGEVAKPGSISVITGKINIIDAINLAGDILMSGKRDDILLMRNEANNQRTFVRLNLNDAKIGKSK